MILSAPSTPSVPYSFMYNTGGFTILTNLQCTVLHSFWLLLNLTLGSEAFNITPFLASASSGSKGNATYGFTMTLSLASGLLQYIQCSHMMPLISAMYQVLELYIK